MNNNGVQKLLLTMRNLAIPVSSTEPKSIDIMYALSEQIKANTENINNILIDLGGIGNHVTRQVEIELGNSQRGTGAGTIRNTTDYIGIDISALTANSEANMFIEWCED